MSGYCEIPEFYSESFPRARKEYHCIECRAPIKKGERHLAYNMKFDGEMYSDRQHLTCRALCMLIRKAFNGGECLCFGELPEWLCEGSAPQGRKELLATPKGRRLRVLIARRLYREWKANKTKQAVPA